METQNIGDHEMTIYEMVQWLVDSDFRLMQTDDFASWLEEIVREGFKGYHHMTASELAEEIKQRMACGEDA